MKKRLLLSTWVLTLLVALAMPALAHAATDSQTMFRMYNPYTGEHMYTADKRERYTTTMAGWRFEGVAWVAPSSSNTPVYRVYNPFTGEHHYTTGAQERDELVRLGWTDEGIGWYSADDKAVPVYRQYNPFAAAYNHNYTTGAQERDELVKLGWQDEGVGWYGSDAPADVPTVGELLSHALEPIGSTMYVFGGGWDDGDTAAGSDATTIGLPPRWAEFAAQQDENYDYSNTMYQIHDGLDCTGYIGWVVYNTLEDESNANDGYVILADRMARSYADFGWGSYTPAWQVDDWRAGDIMSMEDHAWIALGTCADGSVLMAHASPQVVTLSGTALPDGSKSDAIRLAEKYMSAYYPDWYARYPNCYRGSFYLTSASRMRWSSGILADPDGLTTKSAEDVVAWLFGERV